MEIEDMDDSQSRDKLVDLLWEVIVSDLEGVSWNELSTRYSKIKSEVLANELLYLNYFLAIEAIIESDLPDTLGLQLKEILEKKFLNHALSNMKYGDKSELVSDYNNRLDEYSSAFGESETNDVKHYFRELEFFESRLNVRTVRDANTMKSAMRFKLNFNLMKNHLNAEYSQAKNR